MPRAPVKGRTYTARKGTGNYSTSKRQKSRTLKNVTGGFQRLKDFERKVVVPVCINTKGHWPIGPTWQAATKAQIADDSVATKSGSALKAYLASAPETKEYAANCANPVAPYPTAFRSASGGMSTIIPPCGTLTNGSIFMMEPMKWQQQTVAADGSIMQQSADHAGAAAKGCQYTGLMTGQRCMYGYLKFALRFAHTTHTAPTDEVHEAPISVRFTVIKLRGKLVDDDGDIRDDFKLLKPFPTGSKYTKLYDSTFTLSPGGHKSLDMTLGINQWLGRKGGIYEVNAGAGEASLHHHRNDPRFLGGDVKALEPGEGANGYERRIEPFCEWGGAALTQADIDQSSYNSDTTRILVLMTSSDDAIGGLFGPVDANDATLAFKPGSISCAGYVTACAYDEK